MHNCSQRLKKGSLGAERQRCRGLDDSECANYDRDGGDSDYCTTPANCTLRDSVSWAVKSKHSIFS